jgi:hypothetical protein
MAFKVKGALPALIAVSTAVLVACGGGGGGAPAPISVAPTAPAVASSVVTFSVLDSNAGNLLTGGTITLTFGGSGATSLRALGGGTLTSVTTTTGAAQVELASGVSPSAASPLSFTVTAVRAGNITVTEPVKLTATGASSVELKMLPLQSTAGAVSNLPTAAAAGNVTTATATTAGSLPATAGNSNFVAAATLPATTAQAAPSQVSVSVPLTVTAFVNGSATTAAATGTVSAQIVVVDPKVATSASVLPPVAATAATSTAPATVDTLANAAKIVLVDSAGNTINRFSAPITLSLDIPSTVINPSTNAAYALNQTLPISTFNEATGAWVRKTLLNGTAVLGTVTAIDATTGNRKVSFQTDSLSWFAVMVPTVACITTQFTVTPVADTVARTFKASFAVTSGQGTASSPQELGDVVIPANSAAPIVVGPFVTTSVAGSVATLTLAPTGAGSSASFSTPVCTQGQGTVQVTPKGSITTNLTVTYSLAANSVGSATCPITRVEPALVTVTIGNKVSSANSPDTGSLTLDNLPLGSAVVSVSQGGATVGSQTVTLSAGTPTATVPFTLTKGCGTVSGGG